jgi:hypothetical protein
MNKTRNYTNKTIKRLFALSGNQCAFPNCETQLVNEKHAKGSNICHIEAKNKGGERYNPDMTDKERDDYPNLILLCIQHHDETDDVQEYTVEKLKQMKQGHEIDMAKKLSPQQHTSYLAELINKISSLDIDEIEGVDVNNSFNPDDKIIYNHIKIYKPMLEEFKVYQAKLNVIYKEIESQGSFKKNALLRNIKSVYLMAKGALNDTSQIEISKNSDKIIETVQNKLWNLFEQTENSKTQIYYEDLNFSLQIIIVDAFMRCNASQQKKPING